MTNSVGVTPSKVQDPSGCDETREQATPREFAIDYQLIFPALFEQAPGAMLVADPEGRILFLNAQIEELFGYARNELFGQPLEMLMPARFRGKHSAQRASYAVKPTFRPMGRGLDLYGLRKDGTEFPAEISLSPLTVESKTVFTCAIRDISERKRIEGLLQSQLSFERMMSRLSGAFMNVPTSEVDSRINEALKTIAEASGFDRTCLSKLNPSGRLSVECSWVGPGAQGVTFEDARDVCPWLVERVLTDGIVCVSAPGELPVEAGKDKEYMIGTGEKSVLGIALAVGGKLLGLLSFATFREAKEWSAVVVSRMKQVADVFSNVLERKQANEELQEAYSRIEELNKRLEQENSYLRQEIQLEHEHSDVVGQSAAIRDVLKQAEQVAMTDTVVLIQGETGTGKELLARTIHNLSNRRSRPMVKINCAALPATLIESGLFGREKGAYTGALTSGVGRFELADKSTIFLDEVGELPMELQPKLLRVIQEGEFERLGSSKTHRVDARIIAATNRDLSAAVTEGRFREDLYYRLSVFPISLPPLRERTKDIEELVWHILQDLGKRMGRNIKGIQSSTMKAFQNYSWPGNIRELRNVIERNLILNSGPIFRAKLPDAVSSRAGHMHASSSSMQEVEREHILRVLRTTAWRIRGHHGSSDASGTEADYAGIADEETQHSEKADASNISCKSLKCRTFGVAERSAALLQRPFK